MRAREYRKFARTLHISAGNAVLSVHELQRLAPMPGSNMCCGAALRYSAAVNGQWWSLEVTT